MWPSVFVALVILGFGTASSKRPPCPQIAGDYGHSRIINRNGKLVGTWTYNRRLRFQGKVTSKCTGKMQIPGTRRYMQFRYIPQTCTLVWKNKKLNRWIKPICHGRDVCRKPRAFPKCNHRAKYRSYDGTCNNLVRGRGLWGAADTPFIRLLQKKTKGLNQGAAYFDKSRLDTPLGFPTVRHPKVATPHEVSRQLFRVLDKNKGNHERFANIHMTFGQFLDHDIAATASVEKAKCSTKPRCKPGSLVDFKAPCFPISFGRKHTPACTPFVRKQQQCQYGWRRKPRTQVNTITHLVDGSQVYGSDAKQAKRLRTNDGTGELRINGITNLLPFDDKSKDACRYRGGCFLAGDGRANENNALAGMHTLFVREHNRIARALKKLNKKWSGEKIYRESRKIVVAILQQIVYYEYLPTVTDLKKYKSYSSRVNPSLSSAFATAAFRFGHSEIPEYWPHLDNGFNAIFEPIPLRNLFFNNKLVFQHGIEPVMYGLAGNMTEACDLTFSPSVAKKLFVPPGHSGFNDLTAINIQRGRDNGIPGYSHWRKFCKLGKSSKFSSLKKDIPSLKARNVLKRLYKGRLDLVDLFAAGVAEIPPKGKAVGRTLGCIIGEQFNRLRRGDRFYFERRGVFSKAQLHALKKSSLARIYCDNMKGIVSVQRDMFRVASKKNPRVSCALIKGLNLHFWKAK